MGTIMCGCVVNIRTLMFTLSETGNLWKVLNRQFKRLILVSVLIDYEERGKETAGKRRGKGTNGRHWTVITEMGKNKSWIYFKCRKRTCLTD